MYVYIFIYIYIHTYIHAYMHTYVYVYVYVSIALSNYLSSYGQFSEFHICFCGLDSGNLKFETVRTNKQHICF